MKTENKIITVILAGGSGDRLWPLSRKKYPKQFLKISSESSLLQDSVLRNIGFSNELILIANEDYYYTIRQQLEKVSVKRYTLLLEGTGRNTAPAIALACFRAGHEDTIFVVPCDHKIKEGEAYNRALEDGQRLAEQGFLVTFGIKPNSPETGFGYIKHQGYDVIAFKEKPSKDQALKYLEEKNYLWNSGMFMFKAGVFLEELQKYRRDIFIAAKKVYDETPLDSHKICFTKEQMETIPADSIDYAIMEKSSQSKVVSADFIWSDIGSFESYCHNLTKDKDGNTIEQNSIYRDCENVLLVNDQKNKLVVVNDVENLVVINTVDALYISKEGKSQNIKEIISQNTASFNGFFLDNIKAYRPWGYYEILVKEPNYQVKKITMLPDSKISLQKHFYRSEHWIVVKGTATVSVGSETKQLVENEGAYINIGELHRIENNTSQEVIIIETALGEKVVEEDILRYEDEYNRI